MNQVPCPGRIVHELGDGFSIGVILGGFWYMAKGAFHSVRDERIKGGLVLIRKRAPILGGSFAMWAGLFSVSSCAMVYLREKEDPLNSVVGGAVTGFLLSIRGGIRRAIPHGIFGGIFLGVIEVVSVLFVSYNKRQEVIQQNKQMNEFKKQMERSRAMMQQGQMH